MNAHQRKLLKSLGWGELTFQKLDGYNEVNCYRLTPIPGRSNRLAIMTSGSKRDAEESMVHFVVQVVRDEAAQTAQVQA